MRGLVNLGNTCFFNTAIQALAHVPPLTSHFFSAQLDDCPCKITRAYKKVVVDLFIKDATDPVNPAELLSAFRERFPEFSHGQHDSQEVVLILIDVFEHSIGKTFIYDIFNGEDAQEIHWTDGVSIARTPFTTMILDVKEPSHLLDLLKDRSEPFCIENYTDDSGKTHASATVQRSVARWPKIICFSFSMYDYKFPIEIPSEFEGRKLFACIVHHGIKHGGHYALLVKRHEKWFVKDDETVQEIPNPEKIRGPFYMAFYKFSNSLN